MEICINGICFNLYKSSRFELKTNSNKIWFEVYVYKPEELTNRILTIEHFSNHFKANQFIFDFECFYL